MRFNEAIAGSLAALMTAGAWLAAGCAQTPDASSAGRSDGSAASAAGTASSARRISPATEPATGPFDEAAALRLSFVAFEQTPGSGWRALSDQERWADAARLIDRYLQAHPDLAPDQRLALSFHAGQMYAFAGDDRTARYRFMDALIPFENPNALIRWNAYMLATIAFLEGDRATLLQSREVILAGPTVEGCKPNLNIVNSLIANFGRPYREAYQASGPPTLK